MPLSSQASHNTGGPWDETPGGSGGGRSQDSGLEELVRKAHERLNDIISGGRGGGSSNRFMFLIVFLGLAAVWIMNAVYTVEADEQGVVLRLGEYSRTTAPGLHFILWPVETVETPKVQAVNQLDFGVTSGSQDGLILAGDQNIVDIRFTVLWKIKNAKDFLFNTRAPEQLVRVVAESAMREIVGRTNADQIRTQGRLEAQNAVTVLIQTTLDSFGAGILITGVQLEKADPPPAVIDAFEEVQRAEQNQNKFIREAEQYRNKLLGEARGSAAKRPVHERPRSHQTGSTPPHGKSPNQPFDPYPIQHVGTASPNARRRNPRAKAASRKKATPNKAFPTLIEEF